MGAVAGLLVVVLVGAVLAVPGDDPDEPTAKDEPTTTTTLPFEPEPGVAYAYRTLFLPGEPLEVAVGDTLIFENADQVDHTFTSDEGLFDSGPVGPGDSYGYAYTEPGAYGFHCEIHPTMTGMVNVVAEEDAQT